jgi:hypothetical protein
VSQKQQSRTEKKLNFSYDEDGQFISNIKCRKPRRPADFVWKVSVPDDQIFDASYWFDEMCCVYAEYGDDDYKREYAVEEEMQILSVCSKTHQLMWMSDHGSDWTIEVIHVQRAYSAYLAEKAIFQESK